MRFSSWKRWAITLKQNTNALYLASRHPRLPLFPKIIIGIVVAYALSPIDLIPDFIPVIGYLDDIILLPIGIWFAIRFVPNSIWLECQIAAQDSNLQLPYNRLTAGIILVIWIVIIIGLAIWLWPLVRRLFNVG